MPPRDAYRRLTEAAQDGRLDALCEAHGICVLTVFGSVRHPDGAPDDIDVAVKFLDGVRGDVLVLIEALAGLTDSSDIDLMDLDRADPVARAIALTDCEPLYEATPGAFIDHQLRAIQERLDTNWLRALDLERLAK